MLPQSEATVGTGFKRSAVAVDGHGQAARTVRAMCAKARTPAGLPFERVNLK
ncbi:hypothetical protein H3U98_07570 [Bifidobacterium sp. W8116]|uniref:Uncharacterized protein n=1 Tax=Bifidobacterium choladohabitans TaxID=2750947 RepID=A0ABS0R1Q9_9BIFI|nr:hypothetical protein [Bifidobacterium choladohabitans]